CHAAGQTKPTPLLLQYGPGDYNCLHQDVYGELVFPLQVAFLLSRPAQDFSGGEFVLTEQRPRMQSRAEVVPLRQGEGVIFPVHHRPVQGTRGVYRVNMRHAKHAPKSPGVYRMIDAKGEVLYVGKAKSIRKRIVSYARQAGHTARIARMIAATASIEFVTTTTETEALLLETNLIKRLRPR